MTLRMALLAGIAMVGLAGPAQSLGLTGSSEAAQTREARTQYAQVQCMTDDGYGRKRSCSQGYKAANPNWRATDACFTDDGYGRKRSCSQGYKAKHKK